MADENPEKKIDRGIIPKSTQREKARAAIEAILSTAKQQIDAKKEVIKPFVIENPQKNGTNATANAIPIKTIEPAKPAGIPELDLDQQIMAQQRKQTTANRKSPGQKTDIPKPPVKTPEIEHINIWHQKTIKNRKPVGSNAIIKEIVTRDIAKMYQKARFHNS